MIALGYLLLGIIIGLGVAGTILAMGATFRQSQEEFHRNASWESISAAIAESERRPQFEVVHVSRGF